MADSRHIGRSIDLDSDQVPEHFCEPCYGINKTLKSVAGFCQNCNENLCMKCYTEHTQRKLYQNHKLVDKSTRPKTKLTPQTKLQSSGVECHLHHGEKIQSFCHGHSQLCCKVCLTVNHSACKTDKISMLARNVQDSQEMQNLIKKLSKLKKCFNDNLNKTGVNKTVIQRNHSDAINEMMKLREEFDQLMTKTKSKVEEVKEKDFDKIEKVAASCDIVIAQIDKMSTNLDTLKMNGETESLFVAMKHAESQISSLEDNLEQTDKENTVCEYIFEPDVILKSLFNYLKELGQLLFQKSGNARDPQQVKSASLSTQKEKKPIHLKDICIKSLSDHYSSDVSGSVVLPNNQILITGFNNNKLKLMDTNQNTIISELQVSGFPLDITKVKDNEVAVNVSGVKKGKVQFVSISRNTLFKGREISVAGMCSGIAYNEKDQTLIVTYIAPVKVEILNIAGSVIKCLDKDSKGDKLFSCPFYVAVCPNKTEMYVTDKHSVTLMTMNGDVKAVFRDEILRGARGICVHKTGLVYVVGHISNTVHQLDPNSGKFELLLDQKDRINKPISISYCDFEDKMYIGMYENRSLRVFQMK